MRMEVKIKDSVIKCKGYDHPNLQSMSQGSERIFKLENERSTPGCECNATVSTKKLRRTLEK